MVHRTRTEQSGIEGLLFAPANFTACHEAGVEPLAIAIIRGGANIHTRDLEELQKRFDGELQIFHGTHRPDIVVILPYTRGPQQLAHALRNIGIKLDVVSATPQGLEAVSQIEARRTLQHA